MKNGFMFGRKQLRDNQLRDSEMRRKNFNKNENETEIF